MHKATCFALKYPFTFLMLGAKDIDRIFMKMDVRKSNEKRKETNILSVHASVMDGEAVRKLKI